MKVEIQVPINDQIEIYLETLLEGGLYGEDIGQVALRLIEQRIQHLVLEGDKRLEEDAVEERIQRLLLKHSERLEKDAEDTIHEHDDDGT